MNTKKTVAVEEISVVMVLNFQFYYPVCRKLLTVTQVLVIMGRCGIARIFMFVYICVRAYVRGPLNSSEFLWLFLRLYKSTCLILGESAWALLVTIGLCLVGGYG